MVCSGLMSRRYPIISLLSSIISDFMTGGCFLSEGQEDGRKKEYNKSGFVVLLIYIYAFYIKKCYFSSVTVRNQRNIVIVGGSNHEISLS